jgi:hypothetical protein
VGPASLPENVGAIRSADSGEESGPCCEVGGRGSDPENARESGPCSSVARRLTAVELLKLVERALTALDAGDTDLARERLRAVVSAMSNRSVTPGDNLAFGPI